jgi:hypothetical protein
MGKKIVSNEEILKKIKKVEKFLKQRSEDKKTIIRFPTKTDSETNADTSANVVIAEAFDQLEHVVIGGLDKEGRWWFSMSMHDDSKALWIIENFKMAVLESALEMEYNEGREI